MPLPTPALDDRTFDQLLDEARARIPRFTPEWTNFNDADPGMTLVALHAWLTETILYRLNQLPDLNYIKFLELLNIRPRPAVAARAQLTFKLKKLSDPKDPLVVLIPKNTQIGVDDPDLEEELIFETDRTLTALNAALAAIIVPSTGANPRELLTEYDAKAGEAKVIRPSFFPFGDPPADDVVCLLGILLRPHRQEDKDYSLDCFPEGELDLAVFVPEVFETDAHGAEITGPMGLESLFPWEVTSQGEIIAWEAYSGTEHETEFTSVRSDDGPWRRLNVLDETAALSRSGHIYLDVPGGIPSVSFRRLSREFWQEMGKQKPPTNSDELVSDIGNSVFSVQDLGEGVWETMGVTDELLSRLGDPTSDLQAIAAEIKAAGILELEAVDDQVWVDVGYDEAPAPYDLTWFRARLLATPEEPPQVSQFLLNTVGATAAVTRVEESVGSSEGRPNQTYRLSRAPILIDEKTGRPQLKLEIVELDQPEEWKAVDDFFGATPDDAVFLLDSQTGTLTFGNGQHGRIPVAGAQIIARSYRYGGGLIGNAGPGTIIALKSALPNVDSVANVRAAAGGADAESLSEAMLRAPHDLRTRERAVTAEDFADLARQTPGVRIQRAYALPLTRADLTTELPSLGDKPGAVTVVILPENKEDTPQPTEDQLRLVCAHLNSRRLITTELYVVGPRYLEIKQLKAEVTASRQFDLKALEEAITTRLLGYFHPLRGGEDGRGWPFGQDIFFGNVYRQILNIPGVLRVLCLNITAENSGECVDVLDVPDGWLVHLPSEAIYLTVEYDPYA